jgi:LysM repeat protein
MTNPNPFVPKGSLLEQHTKSRSQFKWAVSGVLAVGVIGLVAILIQGCKREAPVGDSGSPDLSASPTNSPSDMSSNSAEIYSNATPNYAATPASNSTVAPVQPISAVPPPIAPIPAVPEASGATTEYTVVSGDTLGKIAHAHGVSLKALLAANPGVDPKKLRPKQKLNIPAGGSATVAAASTDMGGASVETGETYVVKSGDTLMKIAKKYHVKVKALQTANNLATTRINVGQKLKIPASAEAAPAATAISAPAAPDMSTPSVPSTPPPSTTAATSAPATAPAH